MFSIARRFVLGRDRSHLFTFCPPGPDDLLKLNSPIVFKGITSACSAASHARAFCSSSSLTVLLPSLRVEKQHCCTACGALLTEISVRAGRQRKSCMFVGQGDFTSASEHLAPATSAVTRFSSLHLVPELPGRLKSPVKKDVRILYPHSVLPQQLLHRAVLFCSHPQTLIVATLYDCCAPVVFASTLAALTLSLHV